jgi:hypothetical protein
MKTLCSFFPLPRRSNLQKLSALEESLSHCLWRGKSCVFFLKKIVNLFSAQQKKKRCSLSASSIIIAAARAGVTAI